mgnify:CR=1 FL=1
MSRNAKRLAIVVGGGHNGLVNGASLAKAGLRTLVLERRDRVGGAAITANLRLSSTWNRSSGVLTSAGISPRSCVTDLPSLAEAAISRIAA